MNDYTWNHLNHLQLGKYAEFFVKMELTRYGLDIYSSEVDDRGIDFVVKTEAGNYYDFQVKSSRNYNYIFFRKDKFNLKENLIAAVVLFIENQQPDLYLIPSLSWNSPNQLLKNKDYIGKQSKPEWGVNLSRRNMLLLAPYKFDTVISTIA